MTANYQHLMEPFKLGNHLLKSRLVATPSAPSFVQQNEPYPMEGLIQHYANKARGGAAVITVSGTKIALDASMKPPALLHEFEFEYDGLVNHYLSQLVESIHNHGSFATVVEKHLYDSNKYDIARVAGKIFPGSNLPPIYGEELTVDQLKRCTDEMVQRIAKLHEIGFDGAYIHMAYEVMLLGRCLSPLTNKRTDQYGGSFENRIRLPLETLRAIKDACGKDFIIEVCLTGEQRDSVTKELIPGGWTIQDTINFAHAASDCIDILHVRGWDMDEQHPLGFFDDEPPYLYLAEAVKKSAPDMAILSVSGHHNPEAMDAVIANGQADLIGMGRGWVSNPDFGNLVAQNRAEDIVPCIRCNKCFRASVSAPFTSRCSVNPLWGIEHRYKNLINNPGPSKKVAIIGGGPAGMQSALTLRKRGHEVVLFEKSDTLGGQLKIADYVSFKWPLRDFKNYLVNQMERQGVEVRLNCAATPEMINEEDFDIVFACMGSVPRKAPFPVAPDAKVFNCIDAYGSEGDLGKKVVIIGAGDSGVETGMYLASLGIDVTLVDVFSMPAPEMQPLHYRTMVQAVWESQDNFHFIGNSKAKEVTATGVTIIDAQGAETVIPADSVILAIGQVALRDEAIAFNQCSAPLYVIGDNRKPASVMELTREAFFAASQI